MSAIQGSEEWRGQRSGKLTASRFADVMAFDKRTGTKPLDARTKYMQQIVFERTSGSPVHEIGSKSMNWGTEIEEFAREAYELETGNIVQLAEFVLHPVYDFIGCSADGLVGIDGGIESKSPHNEAVHISTLLEGMPECHIPQVQGCMFVTGRKWWDFISYDPRQCERLRLYVQRVYRDDAYISELAAHLIQFNKEANAMIEELMKAVAA